MTIHNLSHTVNPAKEDTILRSQLKNAAFGIVLMELAGAVTYIIDGIITSRFLGSTALAASGMTGICFTILAIISGVFSAGTQQLCCNDIGRGDVERANRTFSTTLLVLLVLSVLIAAAGIGFADGIATLIGASPSIPELHTDARNYIRGFFFGAPAHLFVAVLIPEVQLEGKNQQITLSIAALTVADIAGDLLNVTFFHGGLLGMGIATSISYYVSAAVLFAVFLRKDALFHIRLSHPDFQVLPSLLNIGLPRATKRIGNLIRPFIINRLILLAGGSIAMAAFTVEQNIRYLTESPGVGISGAVLLLVGMFFGEKDLSAIKRTVKISLQYIELMIGGLAVIYFIAAPWLALLYLPASSPSYSLAVLILRCHAVSLPFLAFNEFYISLVQGTGNLKAAHLVTLLNKLIYIVLLSFLLEPFYGVYGLWVSIPLSEVLLCLSIYLVNGIKNRNNQLRASRFSLFNDVDPNPDASIELRVTDQTQLPETIRNLEAFCRQQQFEAHQSYHIQLFFEELILLIIEHGFQEKKHPSIDVRIVKETDGIILRVKDNCRPFSAAEQKSMYDHASTGDYDNYIGIQMIFKLAKDANYIHAMNLNQFIIKI